jgi:hypothetical protein
MHRIRTAAVALVLSVAAPTIARAQSSLTVAGGYSFLSEQGSGTAGGTQYQKGWFGSAGWPVARRLRLTGEISGHYRTNLVGEAQRLHAFLGGAALRLAGRGRLELFADLLAGAERFSEPGLSQSGLLLQVGAGVHVPLGGPLGLRAAADYRVASEDGSRFQEIGATVGLAWTYHD